MDFKRAYGFDKKAAIEGKWFDLLEDGRVKVTKHNNAQYKAEYARLQKKNIHKLRGSDNITVVDDLLVQAMAKTILVDWEGIVIDGKEIPYSFEMAYEFLSEYSDFRDAIAVFSVDLENFKPEDQEELVGK